MTPFYWLIISTLVLALCIKLVSITWARKLSPNKKKIRSKKPRLEPNAILPNDSALSVKYRANQIILSKSEQTFFKALQQSMGDLFLILIKVRASNVLQVEEEGVSNLELRAAKNRIASKHFDFLLCKRDKFEIIAAVELNDQNKKRVANLKSDEFLTEACKTANFPLIRITARQMYDAKEIKATILGSLREFRIKQAA